MTIGTQYAPIYIPTLCRHKHFILGVESLKKIVGLNIQMFILGLIILQKSHIGRGIEKYVIILITGIFQPLLVFMLSKELLMQDPCPI